MDIGCKIIYDTDNDRYLVKPPNCTFAYIFSRRENAGLYSIICNRCVRWSKYARKPADGHGSHFQYFQKRVLFTTVIDNQKLYSEREITNAAKARHFMAMMGADTSCAAKLMIKNINNCEVTDRDIDIADQI